MKFHKLKRYIDSFTWKLFNPLMSPEDFAIRTCADMALNEAFSWKIALQIIEQNDSYIQLFDSLLMTIEMNPALISILENPIEMIIAIRHNSIDYSDRFMWILKGVSTDPETFARKTREDLGLPFEMESVIAYKIRETMIKSIANFVEDPESYVCRTASSVLDPFSEASGIKVSLVPSHISTDMSSLLWKKARPTSQDEQAAISQPKLPIDVNSNSSIWISNNPP